MNPVPSLYASATTSQRVWSTCGMSLPFSSNAFGQQRQATPLQVTLANTLRRPDDGPERPNRLSYGRVSRAARPRVPAGMVKGQPRGVTPLAHYRGGPRESGV